MERKECFGSIQEIVYQDDLTMVQATFGCRDCMDFKACLQFAKERDELRKQNMIAKIIDLSEVHSNEIVSCLLECLSRIYSSTLGVALFRNFLLFYEVPKETTSSTLTIPISPSMLELIDGEEGLLSEEGFTLRIVLFQSPFPGQQKANKGLIACEVARAISSDGAGVKEILKVLSEPEGAKFKRLDPEHRIGWLIERWGFKDEFQAFQAELPPPKGKKRS